MIDIVCPNCSMSHPTEESVLGKRVRCEDCGFTFTAAKTRQDNAPVKCPSCKTVHLAPRSLKGKMIRCNDCGHEFLVTATGSAKSEPVRPPSLPPPPVTLSPVPPPVPEAKIVEGDRAHDVLGGYQGTSAPASPEIKQKLKTVWAAVRKRAQRLKLKRDIRNLHTAIDEKCETLGTLTLQHRPQELDLTAEIAELEQIHEVLGQKRMTRDSLEHTSGSGSVLRELKREIAQHQAREREVTIRIGRKAEEARPETPEAAAHYLAIDRLRASLSGKSDQLATLEAEIGPVLGGEIPRLGSLVGPLKLVGGAAAAILVVYFLWTLTAASLMEGDVPRRYRYYIPGSVRGLSFIDFDRLRETDLYADLEPMSPAIKRLLPRNLDVDDVEDLFFVTLRDFSTVTIVRTMEDLSLEDFLPESDEKLDTSDYKGIEYGCFREGYRRYWAAKTDTCTYAVSHKEDALKTVLRRLERREEPELYDELQTALRCARKGDHYMTMRVPDLPDLYPHPFREVLDSVTGIESFGVGLSLGSPLDLNAAIVFHRERDAERFNFGDLIERLEDDLRQEHMPDEVRDSFQARLDMLRRLKTSCNGNVVRLQGSWNRAEIKELMERMFGE